MASFGFNGIRPEKIARKMRRDRNLREKKKKHELKYSSRKPNSDRQPPRMDEQAESSFP